MAVVPRKRKKSTVYYVVTPVPNAKPHWDKVGTDKREAERIDARRKREVEAGTFAVERKSSMRFGDYLASWMKERTTRNKDEDIRVIESFLLAEPRKWLMDVPLDALESQHGLKLVEQLLATRSEETGKTLSHKYVSNIYGLYTSAIRSARIRNLITIDPCVLPRGVLRRKARRHARKPYDLASVTAMCVDAPMSEGRVFAALMFYTGMREGEGCGRRFRDINPAAKPLACLDITSQYDDQPLKTNKDHDDDAHNRKAPILPALTATIEQWWHEGFEWTYCRKPGPDDFIVPRTKDGRPHTKSSAYKLFRKHAEACGIPNLSLHSTRHTFLTLSKRHGADKDVIEQVTHNRRGEVVDEYIHADWMELCKAAICFDAPLQGSPPPRQLGPAGTLEPCPTCGAPIDEKLTRPQKHREKEWRRRESNRDAEASACTNPRPIASLTPLRGRVENTQKDAEGREATSTIAHVNGSRQQPTDHAEIITRAQVAKLLQVTEHQVTLLVKTRGLPGHRLGAHWRYRYSEVLGWLDQQGPGGAKARPRVNGSGEAPTTELEPSRLTDLPLLTSAEIAAQRQTNERGRYARRRRVALHVVLGLPTPPAWRLHDVMTELHEGAT